MTAHTTTTALTRRTALRGGLATAAGLALTGCANAVPTGSQPRKRSARAASPFTLGVASGDPSPDGMVLWTRLARDPLAGDGLGGMPPGPVEVEWELAADPRFGRPLQRGVARTGPELGYAVHVETTGLPPGREFHYRFRTGGQISPVGRTRTAPAPTELGSLTMCFASCSRYHAGHFTAYRRMAEDNPDLVLHLGDYIYEGGSSEADDPVRRTAGGEAVTLADYRVRHAEHRADPDLQAAHAAAPWLVVWDDHEIENNWADEISEDPDPNFLARRAAAMRAYYENMPLRSSSEPDGPDMRLYRRVGWGALATFHMLDTRQYRADQPCGDEYPSDCPERTDPTRPMLGAGQEAWLLDGFARSRARWDVLGQQVFFSQLFLVDDGERGYNPDAWDGYVGARDRIVDGWTRARVRNPVVLTGDVHSHWAAEVKSRYDDPSAPTVGTELVTTSITSGGDGSESRDGIDAVLAENPHVKFFNNRRGYVRARLTPDELTADFRVVPYVTHPGAPAQTRGTFVVADRRPGLDPA